MTPVTPRHFCVAGVALGDIHLDFTWQAWHNLTSTVVLRGRRGTDGTGWRAWTGLGAAVTPVTPRHFCVAGVALGDIHLDFTWHAVWHNLTSMTPAVDHDLITSHRACRKSSQNLRLRPKECRTLLWSAEVWRAHHRFDRGSAIKDLSGSNVGKKTIRAWWNSKKAGETRRET